jgi:hypothetical protein
VSGAALILAGGWTLRLAALTLAVGALRLFHRSLELGLDPLHLAWLAPLSAALGVFKARGVMRPRLLENIAWLRERRGLPAWRVFPPLLLLFIACMVALVALLRGLAAEHALGLALLGGLELAVATALALSAGLHGPHFARRAVACESTPDRD